MSIKIMTKVWDESSKKGSTLLLLLAIADHADDDGFCWPGIAHLAHKIRMSERSVMRKIQDLEETDELAVVREQGEHNWYIVRIGMTENEVQSVFAKRHIKWTPDNLSPVTHVSPTTDKVVTPPVTQLCDPNLHEPSNNHHTPSGDEISNPQEQEPPDNADRSTHIWDLEESPGTEHACPSCDGMYSLGDLKRSQAACPHCRHPVRVVAGDNIVKKAARPQGKVTGGLGEWMPCVKAFCARAPLASFASMTKRARFAMAGVIKDHAEFATDEPDPSFAVQVISSLDITYQPEGLSSPNQIRFYTPFREAMQNGRDPAVITWGNEPEGEGEVLRW